MEMASKSKLPERPNINNDIIIMVIAPGKAPLRIFPKKLPSTSLLFASKLKKKDGIPIANKSIIINWFVEIGYAPPFIIA